MHTTPVIPTSFVARLSQSLGIQASQVQATVHLLDEGATIPFMARYRKEATGGLDEVALIHIREALETFRSVEARRAAIVQSLDERGLLQPQLAADLNAADTLTRLEDLYQPYRPKRRTRASVAKDRGLEPLADFILANLASDPHDEALRYLGPEVPDASAALQGACDILAERVSDDASSRQCVRQFFDTQAQLCATVVPGKESEAAKYKDYFNWSEPLAKAPSHRVLAIRRAEQEGLLYLRIHIPDAEALMGLESQWLAGAAGPGAEHLRQAIHDGYRRLLLPSLETEARLASKKKADAEAIRVFAQNLKDLLLAPPLGQKRILAIDPGFRTGCKVVVLSAQGALLHHDVVYIGQSAAQEQRAGQCLVHLCSTYQVQAIAVGSGTGGREAESFVRGLSLPGSPAVVRVSESGASVYSASDIAREEFPDCDVTVRGAISIGRRLMDPLAELVKIDPRSIGVGQYQHDVDPDALRQALDDVVVSCVNAVGVEVNTASYALLAYVSGLNKTVAQNIVQYRSAHGPFQTRQALTQVARLGPKAFEQAAGFLRIGDAAYPLDASAVHPERYSLVEQMAQDLGCSLAELLRNPAQADRIDCQRYVTPQCGLPTLQDIIKELKKPGRDPRDAFQSVAFSAQVHTLADLQPGMVLPGVVTNVAAFGAFVDIGVHHDGLVHVSHLADHFVADPSAVVKVHQPVRVTVLEVDHERQRISLSMKTRPQPSVPAGARSGPLAAASESSAPRRGSGRSGGGSRSAASPRHSPTQPASSPHRSLHSGVWAAALSQLDLSQPAAPQSGP